MTNRAGFLMAAFAPAKSASNSAVVPVFTESPAKTCAAQSGTAW